VVGIQDIPEPGQGYRAEFFKNGFLDSKDSILQLTKEIQNEKTYFSFSYSNVCVMPVG
jgi:hypothetical protein